MVVWLWREDKTKYIILVTLGCLLSKKVWLAVRVGSFWPKIYRPDWTKGGTTWQSGKSRWKKEVICLVSIFASWAMVLKLSKKVPFLQFCADFSKKSKSVKVIYIYTSENSCYAISESSIVYYAMTYCFEDIRVWSRRMLLNFCWVSIFFDILIANISWTVAQTPIK